MKYLHTWCIFYCNFKTYVHIWIWIIFQENCVVVWAFLFTISSQRDKVNLLTVITHICSYCQRKQVFDLFKLYLIFKCYTISHFLKLNLFNIKYLAHVENEVVGSFRIKTVSKIYSLISYRDNKINSSLSKACNAIYIFLFKKYIILHCFSCFDRQPYFFVPSSCCSTFSSCFNLFSFFFQSWKYVLSLVEFLPNFFLILCLFLSVFICVSFIIPIHKVLFSFIRT